MHSSRTKKSTGDPFLNVRLTPENMDLYLVRTSILAALMRAKDKIRGTVLDVGCGGKPYKTLVTEADWEVTRYIGIDTKEAAYEGEAPELYWVDEKIPLSDGTVDSAICTEVLEHCPRPSMVIAEICRVLKPGGTLFFTTPFLWPLHEAPFDEYRFTPYSLRRHLEENGFVEVDIEALGGWDKSLAQMIGLWVRRRPGNWLQRIMLSWLAYPVYCFLVVSERGKSVRMGSQCMLTGLSGTAMKPD